MGLTSLPNPEDITTTVKTQLLKPTPRSKFENSVEYSNRIREIKEF